MCSAKPKGRYIDALILVKAAAALYQFLERPEKFLTDEIFPILHTYFFNALTIVNLVRGIVT